MRFFSAVFLCVCLISASQQDEMTAYIVQKAAQYVCKRFPEQCPKTVVPRKTDRPRPFTGDTLDVPEIYWGYSTTNDYRLHFFSGFSLFLRALEAIHGRDNPERFFLNCGRAAQYALEYINTLEQDSVLNDLIIYQYVRRPYFEAAPDIIISRDFQNDSLRHFCVQKAILAYRCDSTLAREWVHTQKTVDYAITGVEQKPLGRKKTRIRISLSNLGGLAVPVDVFLDMAGRDTVIALAGFGRDTILTCLLKGTVQKVLLDPRHRLFDANEANQQYVSTEFLHKRRVYRIFSILLWDLVSALISMALMLLAGILIHRLTALFYHNNPLYAGLFLVTFILVKWALPMVFYGFNLWGFVYTITLMASTISVFWLSASLAGVYILVYYVFQKDGMSMNRLENFLKFLVLVCAVEPLVCALGA